MNHEGRLSGSQRDLLTQHGNVLRSVFPAVHNRHPIQLCQELHRFELKGREIAVRLVRDENYSDLDLHKTHLLDQVERVLRFREVEVPVSVVTDTFYEPEPDEFMDEYALVISAEWLDLRDHIHYRFRDSHGRGILIPEVAVNGQVL